MLRTACRCRDVTAVILRASHQSSLGLRPQHAPLLRAARRVNAVTILGDAPRQVRYAVLNVAILQQLGGRQVRLRCDDVTERVNILTKCLNDVAPKPFYQPIPHTNFFAILMINI